MHMDRAKAEPSPRLSLLDVGYDPVFLSTLF